MKLPTNTDLQAQIKQVDKKVESRHRSVMKAISAVRTDFSKLVDPLVKYVDSQKTIEQYVKDHPEPEPIRSNGNFNWARIIELLVQALVASITIIGVLVGTGSIDV